MDMDSQGRIEAASFAWIFIYNPMLKQMEFYDYQLERFINKDSTIENGMPFLSIAENSNAFIKAWDQCLHLKEHQKYSFTCVLKDAKESVKCFEISATGIKPGAGDNGIRILFTGKEKRLEKLQETDLPAKKLKTATLETFTPYSREQEEFLHLAAHDLLAPVRKLSTLMDRLVLKTKSDLSEKSIVYINRIELVLKQMSTLIDSLLTLYDVSVKGIEFASCDLNSLFNEILLDMDPILQSNDVKVSLTSFPVIKGNAYQLKSLFQNLLYNAVQFKKENTPLKIELFAEPLLAKEQSAFNLQPNKQYYKMTVADNGMGV